MHKYLLRDLFCLEFIPASTVDISFFVRRSSDSNHACNYVRDLEVPARMANLPRFRPSPVFLIECLVLLNSGHLYKRDCCQMTPTKNKQKTNSPPHFCSLYPTPPNPASN